MVGLYGARGWLYCVFLAAGLRLTASTAISRLPIIAAVMVALWRSFFFLGTDDLGRDVLSRLLSGARQPWVAHLW